MGKHFVWECFNCFSSNQFLNYHHDVFHQKTKKICIYGLIATKLKTQKRDPHFIVGIWIVETVQHFFDLLPPKSPFFHSCKTNLKNSLLFHNLIKKIDCVWLIPTIIAAFSLRFKRKIIIRKSKKTLKLLFILHFYSLVAGINLWKPPSWVWLITNHKFCYCRVRRIWWGNYKHSCGKGVFCQVGGKTNAKPNTLKII